MDGPTRTPAARPLISLSRRRLIELLAVAGGGAVIVGCRSRGRAGTPKDAPMARALGFDTDLALTPNADFYVMKRGLVPEVVLDDWVLTIGGDVDQPVRLTFDDLARLPEHAVMRTLECIGNKPGGKLIGNAVWSGAAMADVLQLAGPRAAELRLNAADGYDTGVSLALASDPRSFLVWRMNGEVLPLAHGYPVRCLFPGVYGQKQPKWLTGITVQAEHHLGYYESRGWSDAATVLVNSRVDGPRHRATVPRGAPLEVRGIAFADESGVARVEVRVDDRLAEAATLVKAPSPHADLCWTEWSWTWHAPEPGNHVIAAWAVDGRGRGQSRPKKNLLGGEIKDGSTEIHSISVLVS